MEQRAFMRIEFCGRQFRQQFHIAGGAFHFSKAGGARRARGGVADGEHRQLAPSGKSLAAANSAKARTPLALVNSIACTPERSISASGKVRIDNSDSIEVSMPR